MVAARWRWREVRQALRHQRFARAHASLPVSGLLPVLTCGEADHPARQAPAYGPETGSFQRREGGTPVCLGTAVANNHHHRGKGQGGTQGCRCSARCPRSRGMKGQPAGGSPMGWALCLPTAGNPVPDGQAGTAGGTRGRGGFHVAAELRKGTHRMRWGRVAVAVPTRVGAESVIHLMRPGHIRGSVRRAGRGVGVLGQPVMWAGEVV